MKNKYIYRTILAVAVVFFAVSCKKDPTVKVETVSSYGQEFFFGEKVPVWTGVQGDLENISYKWICTGGSFSGARTQDLFENLWVAPAEPGTYTITVKAKDGDVSDSKSVDMKVTRFFIDEFAATPISTNTTTWAGSSVSNALAPLSFIKTTYGTSAEIQSSSSSSNPTIRTTLTSVPLLPPFSIRTSMGYAKYRAVSSSNDVATSNLSTYFSIYFVQPTTNVSKPYIREVRLEMLPGALGTKSNWRLRYETQVPLTGRTNSFNGLIAATASGRNPVFTFGANVTKNFTFTFDKDIDGKILFSVWVDGVVWIDKSNAIQTFLDANQLTSDVLLVKEFRITTPRLSSSSALVGETTIVLNSLYINNENTLKDDGTVGFVDLGPTLAY